MTFAEIFDLLGSHPEKNVVAYLKHVPDEMAVVKLDRADFSHEVLRLARLNGGDFSKDSGIKLEIPEGSGLIFVRENKPT